MAPPRAAALFFVPNALRLPRPPAASPSSAPAAAVARPVCLAARRATVRATLPPLATSAATKANGRRHTPESRRKIAMANRGNVPWNKGRPHSEETRRKIAENTRKAMLKPEMRRLLKQRATGRKHSEETKMKIRNTSRLVRGSAVTKGSRVPYHRRSRRRPLPFMFEAHAVRDLNQTISQQIDSTFRKAVDDDRRYVVRSGRSLSESTKAKLSQRIKQMWADPQYRARVAHGIQQRRQTQAAKHRLNSDSSVNRAVASKKKASSAKPAKSLEKTRRQHLAELQDGPIPDHVQPLSERDILLRADDLDGITMEDLGITDSHQEGIVLDPAPLSPSFFDPPSEQPPTTHTSDQLAAPSSPSWTPAQPTRDAEAQTAPPLDLDWMLDLSADLATVSEQQTPANQPTSEEPVLCNIPISPHVDAHVLENPVRLTPDFAHTAAIASASLGDQPLELCGLQAAEQIDENDYLNSAESLSVSRGSDVASKPLFKLPVDDTFPHMPFF